MPVETVSPAAHNFGIPSYTDSQSQLPPPWEPSNDAELPPYYLHRKESRQSVYCPLNGLVCTLSKDCEADSSMPNFQWGCYAYGIHCIPLPQINGDAHGSTKDHPSWFLTRRYDDFKHLKKDILKELKKSSAPSSVIDAVGDVPKCVLPYSKNRFFAATLNSKAWPKEHVEAMRKFLYRILENPELCRLCAVQKFMKP